MTEEKVTKGSKGEWVIPASTVRATGGIIGSSGTITTAPHSWSTTTNPLPGTRGPELVDLPHRMSKKVLVSFLDEDDDPIWAKKLLPMDVNINIESDGTARMTIELSLVKYYRD